MSKKEPIFQKTEKKLSGGGCMLLIGATGSGKTVIIKDLMRSMKDFTPRCTLYSKTAVKKEDTEDGFTENLPDICIFPKATEEEIQKVSSVQSEMIKKVNKSKNYDILMSLFKKRPDMALTKEIESLGNMTEKKIALIDKSIDINLQQQEKDDIIRTAHKYLIPKLNKYIQNNINAYTKYNNLSDDEYDAITFINCNPNMVLIFDDITADLPSLARKKDVVDLIFAGRHDCFTTIVAIQDVKFFNKDLRAQPKYIIFTEMSEGRRFFDLCKEKETQAKFDAFCSKYNLFKSPTDYRKVVLTREKEFFIYTAEQKDFKMCNPIMWKFNRELKKQ
jgi:hypothetical protein